MNILIIGGGGMVGQKLAHLLASTPFAPADESLVTRERPGHDGRRASKR